MNFFPLFNRLVFVFVLIVVGTSCGNDDDAQARNGTISLTPGATTYEAVRGTAVNVSVTAAAEDGIQSVVAMPSVGSVETFTVPSGATSFTAEYTFTVPADAKLDASNSVLFELEDSKGQKTDLNVEVGTAKLLTANPATYAYTRDGNTSVSYSGQTDRLNMVAAIKAYLNTGDSGSALSAQVLKDAYSNTNDDGNGFFSFTSSKQLSDKTFQPDLDKRLMESLFEAAEQASMSGVDAKDGQAGLITRENKGTTVLVDANGREFTQMVEKGLMGTVMYNQIYNTYFSEDRMGDDVENTELKSGTNYTNMEHHWDEAFGYISPPLDFTSNWPAAREGELRFWSNYSNVVDPFLGTNDKIMNAFLEGRTAIVNNDMATKNAQRDLLFEQLELTTAATAIHYINATITQLNDGNTGEAFHTLSEAWAFVNALTYSPKRSISLEEIETINETDFGADGNFWNVTAAGLNKAKATLVTNFPELESVKDAL